MEQNTNSVVEMPKATLKIESTTRDRLKSLSQHMDDTFDAIICRLIDEHEDHKKGKS